MKIIVEISDLYTDEVWFEAALKAQVIHEAVAYVKKDLKTQIESEMVNVIHSTIQASFKEDMQSYMEEMLKSPEKLFPGRYNSDDKQDLKTYMQRLFLEWSGSWNNPKDLITKLGDKFSKEMTERYDLMFASVIVNRMKDAWFLKDEFAKSLLTDSK